MMTDAGDIIATVVPWVFIMASLLASGYQYFVQRRGKPTGAIEVDPGIRVRVTGKIS